MGKLESENKKRIRRSNINDALISAVAVAGILTIGALAPNVLGLIAKSKYFRQRAYQVKSSLSRLVKAGYLHLEVEDGRKRVRLTPKGEKYAALLGEGRLALKKPRRWDGKWRMLIFDISEKRRKVRTQMRSTLQALGLFRLQDSVWVYPYDCEDAITIIKADLRIGKDLLYVIADKIEYDLPLKRHFKLV